MRTPTASKVCAVLFLAVLLGPAYGGDSAEDLIVFIGKRIAVAEIPRPTPSGFPEDVFLSFDQKSEAKYQVLEVIFGDYREPEIAFAAYDHYGRPDFANYETVLLYVSRYPDGLVHQKYQFQDVYRTADGKWAGCGDPYKNEPPVHRGSVQARPMDFKPEVVFPLEGLTEEQIKERYPDTYFVRRGAVAICKAGVYADDLFAIKRQGVLRARGIFK